jgi:hypothetical protein
LSGVVAFTGLSFLIKNRVTFFGNVRIIDITNHFKFKTMTTTNKITKDGFIWLLVTDKAKEIYQSGLFSLYKLYNNNADGLIESLDDLNEALERGVSIGIEVGFVEPVATARYVAETYVTDPDTGSLIDMAVYKHENEGMICIDASFIEQVAIEDELDDTICYIGDPFNLGGKLKLIENDNDVELN